MKTSQTRPVAGAGAGAGLRQARRGAVLVLTLEQGPANALDAGLVAALRSALAGPARAPGVAAVLITGGPRLFSAGIAPGGLGQPRAAADLAALAREIETFPLPVSAALSGNVFGAGLELAMAAHWRIAAAGAQFALPEVHLGLVPGSGGSQRLARLVGGTQALRLLLAGAPVPAAEALAMGLVDQVVTGDFPAQALSFAETRPGPRPTALRLPDVAGMFGPDGALARARAELAGHRLPAPARVVDCVEAALLLPLEQGLAVEATAFGELAASDEAAGLLASWQAERRAAQPPASVARAGQARVDSLGLWQPPAAGIDGLLPLLGAGLTVVLGGASREELVARLNQVAARQRALVAAGRLTPEARDADWARLIPVLGAKALAQADLILAGAEAPAEIDAGRRLWPGGLAPGQAGVALTLPEAPGQLAEIALSPDAEPALAARALALVRRLGGRAVFAGPGGPILARLRRALAQAVAHLEGKGIERQVMAASMAAFGMGAGPQSHLPPMPPQGEAILRACLAALAAEGARLVEAGTAPRPAEIDAAAILAGLVPRWEGGPMAWADRLGLLVLRADLWARQAEQPALYAVAPLIDRLLAQGLGFASLNGRARAEGGGASRGA